MIVLDSSVVLASVFEEPGRIELVEVFAEAAISSVNLGEVVSKCVERKIPDEMIGLLVEQCSQICHPLSVGQAVAAGGLRNATRALGLSLGDRCCLALAMDLKATVFTADRAWAGLDLGIPIRVIR